MIAKVALVGIGRTMRLWMGIALVMLAAGVAAVAWTVTRTDRALRERFLVDARLAACAVNLQHVQALTVSSADLGKPEYVSLKRQLARARKANPLCRFVYLMGRRPHGALTAAPAQEPVCFLVDSEAPDSPAYSPPGQVFEEVPDDCLRAFSSGAEGVTGPVSDRWGVWVSALIPLHDPQSGSPVAVLGMDVDARAWRRTVLAASVWPAGGTLAALALLGVSIALAQSRRRILLGREALQQQEAQEILEHTFHCNPSPMALATIRDLRLVTVNDAFLAMTGYARVEVVGRSVAELGLFDDVEQAAMLTGRLRAGDRVAHHELRLRRKDGTLRDGLLSGESITCQGQEFCLTVILDITERKRAEAVLRESEERFRSLLQNVPSVAVQGYRMDGTTQYWNRASERLYGYPAQEAIGRNLLDLIIPPEMRQDVERAMRQMAETGEAVPASELALMRKDGSRVPVFSSHAVVRIPGRLTELFCIDVDLTDLKRMEAERERLAGQFQQAQKMESIGRLAGGVAHDFNNMLSVILGHTEMALDGMDAADPLSAGLQEIRKAAHRSVDLTRQLLAFARKQTVVPRVLDMNETVEDMLQMLRRLIGENIELVWLPGKNLGPVRMDPSQINQILVNLCVNARDAIRDTGRVVIETNAVTVDAAYCARHSEAVPGEYVTLAVSDDGCGMGADTLSRLFEPFFTTKEVGKGTGLGLSTVYGIVKQNNGFITVNSQTGRGASFTTHLPRHAAKADRVPQAQAVNPDTPGRETILLVEDEPAILNMTRTVLERQGYTVLAATTPGEAMRLGREHAGRIHLLVTDVVMPELNGRDLAKNLLTLYPDIKRLFMSGYTADVIAHHGVLDEGVHFIQKPFSLKAMAAKVREALDGSAALSDRKQG